MKLPGALLAATLLPAASLATTFETFNPLLRYRPSTRKARPEESKFAKRQTQASPFLNANTTSMPTCVQLPR